MKNVYLVHLRGFTPFATASKHEALEKLNYLLFHGFRATMTKISTRKYIYLACTRYC